MWYSAAHKTRAKKASFNSDKKKTKLLLFVQNLKKKTDHSEKNIFRGKRTAQLRNQNM